MRMRTDRRPHLHPHRVQWLSLLVLLAGCGSGEAPEDSIGHNVLLVSLDTTRVDFLGCYGHADGLTPRLDALAREGVRFDRAIATAGLTPMSHASMLTGRNPYSHNLRVFSGELGHSLPATVPSLPEILSDRGWRTAAFVSAYPLSEVFGLNRGYATFSTGIDEQLDLSKPQASREVLQDARRNESQRRADHTVDGALTWLEEHGESGPWHLWVHLFDVHDPQLIPPAEFAAQQGVDYKAAQPFKGPNTKDQLYGLELRWVDHQVGRLLDWLESSKQYENTVVIVVSDHGQGLSDGMQRHQWSQHRLIYDWSIHVPLIFRIPGELPRPAIPELVRTTDILPTVLEVLDLAPPEDVQGRSLMRLVRGELDEPRIAYADALNLEDTYSPGKKLPEKQRDNLYVAMDQRWKLIHHAKAPENSELYDLDADPGEIDNVLAEHPEEAARLLAWLEGEDAFRMVPSGSSGPSPDGSALGGLGYTGDGGEDDDEEDKNAEKNGEVE